MNLIRRLQYLWRGHRMDRELAEEMEFHRAAMQQDLEDSGLSREAAAAAGRRAMGAATQMREESRAVWLWPWLESVLQDVSYAIRSLRRQPGFLVLAVGVLACAIGLNTSLFTVYNAIAFRPWPVPEPARVVRVLGFVKNPPKGLDNYRGFTPPEYRYIAEHTRTMTGLFLTRGEGGLRLEQHKARTSYVSGNYFQTLQVPMAHGRGFLTDEDRLDAPEAVMVLSDRAWRNWFGADPDILGRRLQFEDTQFLVVGIAAPDFAGTDPERTDLWVPLASAAILYPGDSWARNFLHDGHTCCGDVGGRLASGFSREQAKAELSVLSVEYHRQHNESGDGVVLTGTALLSSPKMKVNVGAIFGLMFLGVTLVLLLACANVGNLLVARTASRRREIGVRLSLGASRWRVVRQLLTESLLLACLAGVLGLMLAWALPEPILRNVAGAVSFRLAPDGTVLAYTLVLAVLTCLACGLAPALSATRGNFQDALKGRRGRVSLRSSLLALQVALSVVLLVSAGLLIHGIQRVSTTDPGFAVHDTASISVDLPAGTYPRPAMGNFFQTLSQSLSELPVAQPYGWTDIEPLGHTRGFTSFHFPGEDEKRTRMVMQSSVSEGYFEVLRILIVAGRNFSPADSGGANVLVNQAMADQFFPGQNVVGKTIVTDSPKQIVGVVRNAYTGGLDSIDPMLYAPANMSGAPHLLVRNSPVGVAAITALVKRMEPRAQITVQALSVNLSEWVGGARLAATIAGMLGILALSLAMIGVAGVFAYSVEQRRQEIGIRMALGARPAQVVRAAFGSASRALVIGLAVGMVGAFAASGLLRKYLFGLSRLDGMAYVGVLLTFAAAGLLATYLPARRATRIDPIAALRQD